MLVFAGLSVWARPLVTIGIAFATPPYPVLVPPPPPVQLTHASRVKAAALSPGAGPNVTYWEVPLKASAAGPVVEAAATGVALVSLAGERLFAPSSATSA